MIFRKVKYILGKLRVNPKSSHHKENIFFLILFLLYLYEIMDTNQTYFGSIFTIFVNQSLGLYTLSLYRGTCRLSIKLEKNFKYFVKYRGHYILK